MIPTSYEFGGKWWLNEILCMMHLAHTGTQKMAGVIFLHLKCVWSSYSLPQVWTPASQT